MIVTCGGSGSTNISPDYTTTKFRIFSNLPYFNYKNGLTSATPANEQYLVDQYTQYKTRYVTNGPDIEIFGKTYPTMKVRGGVSSDYDTTSQNMGYTMLLAVIFNDQQTFDRLYAYVCAHLNRSDGFGLMHRKISDNNVNESEFRIRVPHGVPYMHKADYKLPDARKRYIAATRDMYSSISMTKYKSISKTDLITRLEADHKINDIDPNNWIPAASNDRQLTSSTDADFDIAMALVLASNKWANLPYESNPVPGFDYRVEAAKNIRNILLFDINSDGYLNNGSMGNNIDGSDQLFPVQWGGQSGWSPSFFCPAWLRAFKTFIHDNEYNPLVTNELYYYTASDLTGSIADATKLQGTSYFQTFCDTLVTTMYTEMVKINNVPNQKFYPDWVDTTGTAPKKSNESDRYYYNTLIDNAADYNTEKYQRMSYNYYYPATRVAWRIGTDFSWSGDTNAKIITKKFAQQLKGCAKTIVDGYSITGGAWNEADRDGFNLDTGGINHSSIFVLMNACASLALDMESDNAKEWYDETVSVYNNDNNTDDSSNQYTCTGDMLRILSLVFLSGKMSNPECLVRIKGIENGFFITNQDDGINFNDQFLRDYTDMTYVDKTGSTKYSRLKLINLGGNDVAIRVDHTGKLVRRAKDNVITCGVSNSFPESKYIGDTPTANPDLYDVNPEAVFTIVDLGTDKNNNKIVAFLHKATQKYLRCSIPYSGLSYALQLDNDIGVFDETNNIRTEISFSIMPQ